MENVKSIFASKTVWGGIVALLAVVAQMLGFTVTAADQVGIANVITDFVALAGTALAIYGRITATKKLR